MDRVKRWHKVTDFLADENIEFKESVGGLYLPYFEPYVERLNNPRVTVEVLEDRYMEAWKGYCEYMREYFKEEKDVDRRLF